MTVQCAHCDEVSPDQDECACGCSGYADWCGCARCLRFHFGKSVQQCHTAMNEWAEKLVGENVIYTDFELFPCGLPLAEDSRRHTRVHPKCSNGSFSWVGVIERIEKVGNLWTVVNDYGYGGRITTECQIQKFEDANADD